jgi:S1-C subfamily serine protease
MSSKKLVVYIASLFLTIQYLAYANASEQILTSIPSTSDSVGKTSELALRSVFRVICKSHHTGGTAFLHRSGNIITAAHVVEGCRPRDLVLVGAETRETAVAKIILDRHHDIALLTPKTKIETDPIQISPSTRIKVGSQVVAWGYPGGYRGLAPLLTVGYLSGVDATENPDRSKTAKWIVNAAFNRGNSGGPLVDVESGDVVGVVSSKLAPMPKNIESALEALDRGPGASSVHRYTVKDGKTEKQLHEGQIVAMILEYLQSQTQLVIGSAVMLNDLRGFMKSQGIDP